MKKPRTFPFLSLHTAGLVLAVSSLSAADGTWDGGGAQALNQGIWGGTNNWNPNGAIADGIGFTAFFGTAFGNGYTCIVNTNRTIGNITYTDPANPAASDFTLARHATDYTLTLNVNTGLPRVSVTQEDRTMTIHPRVAGNDGLEKTGPGRLVLTNATLLLRNPCLLNAGSEVTVNGGTLSGSGTIGGNVIINTAGSAAPGEGAGTLFINGSLDISSQASGTGQWHFELDAPAAVSDLVTVGGSLNIGGIEPGSGTLGMNNFAFTNLGGMAEGTYKLITSTALSGSLDPADLTAAIGAFTGTLQLNSSDLELVVSAGGSAFTAWQAANGTGGSLSDDHDGDGLANGIEYFAAGPADSTGFTPLPVVIVSSTNPSVTWIKAAGYPGTYGSGFVVETSATLTPGSWVTETIGDTVSITGNDVKFTFPAGTRNFVRLKVTGP
jgi:hypothetical protein